MKPNAISLNDKYTQSHGQIFLTGLQTLVRLPMMQRQRDLAAGLNTAGFISGYRGSPIGRYDMELWRASKLLDEHHIKFLPAVNEDLAATSVWGTQEVNLFPGATYDGVFGIWYGKGPGLARSIDAFKHGNLAGASATGGVLAVVGDDPGATSSGFANPSEFSFMDVVMPVLQPGSIQDILEFGLLGFALSRACGLWVGFKTEADTIESSGTIEVDPERPRIVLPKGVPAPEGGFGTRIGELAMAAERRQFEFKLDAAKAFARANHIDRIVLDAPKARFGICASGKSYLDVRRALRLLGIDEAKARSLGLRVLKLGMIWPLEPTIAREFAKGLKEILVVEEKRPFIETQFKEMFYNERARSAQITGRNDEEGKELLPSYGVHTPEMVAKAIAKRLLALRDDAQIKARLKRLEATQAHQGSEKIVARTPYFCSGCPHNTSTRLPQGSRGIGGVGCHFMAVWMDRDVYGWTHMGGEGATWIGQAPFTSTNHVFQSLGDGTYYHSGLLAIRAAQAAKVNITYKILFNDAVAMTGGQPIDGPISVPMITQQVAGEGIERIAVVSDEPGKYPIGSDFAPGVTFHHRSDLDQVQRDLREWPGVSILIYDQTCAAEKRRRRKRGTMPDPEGRVFINQAVCEGCGDCVEASNCLSVVPVETEFGRKRAIEQYSCNKDYSCINGFCPALVTVKGGRPRRASAADLDHVEEPPLPPRALAGEGKDGAYDVLIAGVGGTGVVTIGAILGMAAHIEGRACTVLDMTGMSQKGGAVLTHLRVAEKAEDLDATRISAASADLLIGCDALVASTAGVLDAIEPGRTRVVLNTHKTIPGEAVKDKTFDFDIARLVQMIEQAAGKDAVDVLEANALASALTGDAIATNTFLLGYAVQKGLIPVSLEAIEEAFKLNAVAVEGNLRALRIGRLAAHDPAAVEAAIARMGPGADEPVSATLDEIIEKRVRELTGYQNAAYAERYRALVSRVREAEAGKAKGMHGLAEAVARYYYKLLAYKDEYEVARLYSDGRYKAWLSQAFEGDVKLTFHLAPPWARNYEGAARPRKQEFGGWVRHIFPLLARLKFLRGTALDPFGRSGERRGEVALIADYETMVDELLGELSADTHALCVEIASIPDAIRGYGPVKERNLEKAKTREAELLVRLRTEEAPRHAAE
ncbi:MAG: indolepyruvate ferredoxin oxidoreductase family protein [Alphaproteobacteria bacterium]